jgi:hypothetical protein
MPSAAELEKLKKCPFGKRNQMRLHGEQGDLESVINLLLLSLPLTPH